ncbi:GntR family transcriptional regulator [Roseobacter weihaiensis]|uniref:GntR family transcriptional regulator n=1 Tax=Roseobacter weihaiensis TaxID=2763262 RepID=UPI001D09C52F|nr:GntR family transcriptional regulator [Roseobacter sp. H9]
MKEINKESLGNAIYGRVAQDLIRGKLQPNQKITIRGLADSLGTSSTPVRDAVQRLLQDNALQQRSVRDVRVPVLTTAAYLEITAIRAELEGLAAAGAAAVAQEKDVALLRRIVLRNEEACLAGRWPLAIEMNQKFHFALAEIAGMPILLDILSRLWLRTGPLISGYYAATHKDMVEHHHQIIAACKTHDPAAARAAMRDDIEKPKDGIAKYIQSLDED